MGSVEGLHSPGGTDCVLHPQNGAESSSKDALQSRSRGERPLNLNQRPKQGRVAPLFTSVSFIQDPVLAQIVLRSCELALLSSPSGTQG